VDTAAWSGGGGLCFDFVKGRYEVSPVLLWHLVLCNVFFVFVTQYLVPTHVHIVPFHFVFQSLDFFFVIFRLHDSILTVDVDTERLKAIEQSLRTEGFKPFEVELGGPGVGILQDVNQSLIDEFMHSIGSVAKQESWLYWS